MGGRGPHHWFRRQYVEAWKYRFSTQSYKAKTYMQITNVEYKMQIYLRCMKNITRQIFARFRTGSYWLQVHVGRFQGTERSSRLCVLLKNWKTRSTVC
jgi:hypothetical protein